jgi:hypothetical protein
MHMQSMRVRNWCVWSVCTLAHDMHSQSVHQFLTRMLSVGIKVGAWCAQGIKYFKKYLKYLKQQTFYKIAIVTKKWSQKLI